MSILFLLTSKKPLDVEIINKMLFLTAWINMDSDIYSICKLNIKTFLRKLKIYISENIYCRKTKYGGVTGET